MDTSYVRSRSHGDRIEHRRVRQGEGRRDARLQNGGRQNACHERYHKEISGNGVPFHHRDKENDSAALLRTFGFEIAVLRGQGSIHGGGSVRRFGVHVALSATVRSAYVDPVLLAAAGDVPVGHLRGRPRLRPRLVLQEHHPERRRGHGPPHVGVRTLLLLEAVAPPSPQTHGQHRQGRGLLPHQVGGQ